MRLTLPAAALLASSGAALAQLDLAQYQLAGRFALPSAASEASAVTYNWDTDTLFVVGDEGGAIVEVSKQGAQLNAMTLSGFDDTEGLTYTGAGRFVLVEERIQDVSQLQFVAGGSVNRAGVPVVSLGDTVGNVGLEGISYDPRNGRFVVVKEKTPQQVREATVDFAMGAGSATDLFVPNLGVLDLSDVQVLSTVPSFIGTPDEDNLLIFSQESSLLLEVSRSGQVLSQFNFAGLADNAEGVAIDNDGTIYIVGENPELYVLRPIPGPTAGLVVAGAALMGARRRRR